MMMMTNSLQINTKSPSPTIKYKVIDLTNKKYYFANGKLKYGDLYYTVANHYENDDYLDLFYGDNIIFRLPK
jgi:hypothetical protein